MCVYYTNIPWISVDNVSRPLYPVLLYPNHVMHSVIMSCTQLDDLIGRSSCCLSKPPHGLQKDASGNRLSHGTLNGHVFCKFASIHHL